MRGRRAASRSPTTSRTRPRPEGAFQHRPFRHASRAEKALAEQGELLLAEVDLLGKLLERAAVQAARLAVLHAGRRLAGRLAAGAAVAAVGGDGHELVLPLPLGDLVVAYLGQLDAEPAGR